MSKESLLQTKLSSDIINIILNYELTLDNLDKKLNLKKTNHTFTPETIINLLIKCLKFGYLGYYMKYENKDIQLKIFNEITKTVKHNFNDIIEISCDTEIVICLKNKLLVNNSIISIQCLSLLN